MLFDVTESGANYLVDLPAVQRCSERLASQPRHCVKARRALFQPTVVITVCHHKEPGETAISGCYATDDLPGVQGEIEYPQDSTGINIVAPDEPAPSDAGVSDDRHVAYMDRPVEETVRALSSIGYRIIE